MPESLIEFADKIRNGVPIVSVVEEYVRLKKTGSNYKGLCPFHKEKTPSFLVSSAKQIYHCFGCGVGGDVVSFIRRIENLSFKDSLILLAKKHNMPLPQFSSRPPDKEKEREKETVFELHQVAVEFFLNTLNNTTRGKIGREYLKRRKIDQAMTDQFRIGLAPGEWEALLKHLRSKGYSERIINLAGLIAPRSKGGGFYDKFRNRLMFPIADLNNRVIAFGGRALNDAPAKYINSPDTPIYRKSEHLYGFNFARNAVREKECVIVVEGYLDLIAVCQFGYRHSVATLGTALTSEQSRLIKRFTKEVVFVYDGDEAGQNAMIRGCEVLVAADVNPKIAVLPENEDPDSLLHNKGKEAFDELISNASHYLAFFLDVAGKKFDGSLIEGKVEIVNFLSSILNNIKNPIKKQDAVQKVSETLSIDQALLIRYLKRWTDRSRVEITKDLRESQTGKPDISERMILKILLDHPEHKDLLPDEFDLGWFENVRIKNWISRILDQEQTIFEQIKVLLSAEDNDAEKQMLSDIIFWEHWHESSDDHVLHMLSENVTKLKIKHNEREAQKRKNILVEEFKSGTFSKEHILLLHQNLKEADDLSSRIYN